MGTKNCDSFISDDFQFPRPPVNRPSLSHIGYRIGTYPDFVETMLRKINASLPLAAWTHRAPDDPGIALLQGAAILGDILTFYQEHYANEAFLRTAQWHESVAGLVRLLGYRLAPGLGGRATFAFKVKGKQSLTIPAGFPIKADLANITQPVDFQTTNDLIAWPHLNTFHLYRRRTTATGIDAGVKRLELTNVEGDSTFELKKGDRLMLLPSAPGWTTSGNTLSTPDSPQIIKVAAVSQILDRTIVELEGTVERDWKHPATAYRLGRTFRHFGYNAPPKTVRNAPTWYWEIFGSNQSRTHFKRYICGGSEATLGSSSIPLEPKVVPLDQEVGNLTVGTYVILHVVVQARGCEPALAVRKGITAIEARTLQFGNLNGPSTFLTLDSPLVSNSSILDAKSDIRRWRIYEVTSPALTLGGETKPFPADNFTTGNNALNFYGTGDQAKTLVGRALLLQHDDGRQMALTCTTAQDDFASGGTSDEPGMWPLSFDKVPLQFLPEDFDEGTPRVTVWGNLAEATQGKAEKEAVLGNGDGRAQFQTFKLPKAPLTYFLSDSATPPQVPELDVYVNDRKWTRVASLFARGPEEEIYIVRQDAKGESWVQFGNGDTGARLPSGINNIKARYRRGNGAHGPLKPGAVPSAGQHPVGLDKILLPGVVSGGAHPESADKARITAPGKVQSLGRMVSLQDYETEVKAIPGVTMATAAWGLNDAMPAVLLRVLLEAGREVEFQDVRATIAHFECCRGPDNFPVAVTQALLRYTYLDLLYACDPSRIKADVEAQLRASLGLAGDNANSRVGLFGLHRRRLGEPEYASRIEGAVQQVPGVLWCRVKALGLFAAGATDPAELSLPAAPRAFDKKLACDDDELLQLYPDHLTLSTAPPPPAQPCE